MRKTLEQLWQFLRTDVREFWTPAEATETGAEVTQAVLEFAIAIGVLANPSYAIAVAALPFVQFGARGIKAYREKCNPKPSLEECVALAAPGAYLESLNDLQQHNILYFKGVSE